MSLYSHILTLCLLCFGQAAFASSLYLFGGGSRPKPAIQSFVQDSLKTGGKILVITWATAEPDLTFQGIQKELIAAGALKVIPSLHQIETKADLDQFYLQLSKVSGVYFTGGDQNLALDTIDKFDIRQTLKIAFQSGKIFAGTSAGTALMPENAMRGGDPYDLPDVRQGLGLTSYLVDQHFIVRDRELRLRKLVQKNQLLGIGVDEGMCGLIKNGKLKVFGPTEVQIFIPEPNSSIRKFEVMDGQEFDLGRAKF